jgi:hypothetical protein
MKSRDEAAAEAQEERAIERDGSRPILDAGPGPWASCVAPALLWISIPSAPRASGRRRPSPETVAAVEEALGIKAALRRVRPPWRCEVWYE